MYVCVRIYYSQFACLLCILFAQSALLYSLFAPSVCVCAQNTNRAREKHDTNAQANHLCDLHVIVRSLSQLDDFVYDGSGNERAQVVFVCFCANRQRQ